MQKIYFEFLEKNRRLRIENERDQLTARVSELEKRLDDSKHEEVRWREKFDEKNSETKRLEDLVQSLRCELQVIVLFNQSRHERSRHRLGMGWTNVLPAGKQRCAGNEKFSGISNLIRNGPFCEFPGIVGIGMKNFKTCIIPEIPHSPGMGMKFFGNPGNKIFFFFQCHQT